ncbi:2Fe-2S iron-sulfur cluster-binding protein [Pelomonas sp. CA6]|uniref:2Fe-2S iron-sulfur cluster-binding protein n=1 Tax=Pelomonas sp. CA6 TaxID=2907999 RepID=UPI001F4B7DA2|nr:2Fe-2S iron-sulfur cluster-binding protein [Pelomonas sp. CA6]MCH7342368.1 2Fe-2S iron-sulfur cluster-binding protein [Pelomonas sp. CA6]
MPDAAALLIRPAPDAPAFACAPGQSVLEAALAAGVALRSSCRNGSCRACLRELAEGRVRYRIEWPGLSAEEKAQGCILPCVAEPLTDLVLRSPATAAG